MELTVVIVNYNVKYFLEQVLLSVRNASKGIALETIVVDNNSVDDSVEMVRRKFPEVTLIVNKENVGFSKANNQAINLSKAPYVLLLNPDTVVEEDTFTKCLAFMETHHEVGGLGVKMIDGSGKFLPESKRGFPTPFVAFCKTFGLSTLFPNSKLFNQYHLGYLSEHENHEVDVLAGAFMMLRKQVLDKIGLLDEAFFMYGEDIDLSYRIKLAGYKNYYLSTARIIHYKGESTKKGSLNYVKVFYNAMIIFAKKHFDGGQAKLFVLMLRMAIYFRATLALLRQVINNFYLVLVDFGVIYAGLLFLKNFWAVYHFGNADYYDKTFDYLNAPLYAFIWTTCLYFIGAYEDKSNLRRTISGVLLGTLVVAAIYGFLDMEYRSSRAVIVLGTIFTLFTLPMLRLVLHFIRYQNFDLGKSLPQRLVIVGSIMESQRVKNLLQEAQVQKNIIGVIAPNPQAQEKQYLSQLEQLQEVVYIYKIEEIIFCSKDLTSQEIMSWMTRLGPSVEYKILPEESVSIIGSSSKNRAGELYTIDLKYSIDQRIQRRNKRLVDLLFSTLLFFSLPIHLLLIGNSWGVIKNIFGVILGKFTWVGYVPVNSYPVALPNLRPGVLSPLDELDLVSVKDPVSERLNFLYAKNYRPAMDFDIILKGYRNLGRNPSIIQTKFS